MSQSVTVSDELYGQLEAAAAARGFTTIEQLLEAWQADERQLRERRDAVRRLDAVRARMQEKYGVQSDSTELIREDRAR